MKGPQSPIMRFKNCHHKSCVVLATAVAFLILASASAFGQTRSVSLSPSPGPTLSSSPTSTPTPKPTPTPSPASERTDAPPPISGSEAEEPTLEKNASQPEPVNYFMPDLPPDLTSFKNKFFDLRIGFAVLADYTLIGQNSISRAQVGPQASIFDLRAGRLVFSGKINFKRPWSFTIGGDYDEHRNRGDRVFDVLDFHLTIPLWKKARITLGKQKEPFIFEMVAVASFLPQQERVLNPFFVSRNIGIRYLDNYLDDKMSFSVGVYNDWFRSGLKLHESGYQVSGRLTGLPIESEDHRTFLHLGLGLRYNGADKDQMRFRARPETNVTDYYADTGNFPAKYAKQLSLEALYNKRSFSVLGEYTQAWVNSAAKANPSFNGSYVTISYFLTDDTRAYDKRTGNIVPITPKSRWGAVELVGRFGYVDLDDTLVQGGKLKTWYAGMNWWMSRQWKIGTGYGLADLDRFGTSGWTQRWLTRVQWIY